MDVIDTISRALASEKLRVRLPLRLIATDSAYPRRRLADLADGRKSLFGSSIEDAALIFLAVADYVSARHRPTKNLTDGPTHAAVVKKLPRQVAGSGGMSEKS